VNAERTPPGCRPWRGLAFAFVAFLATAALPPSASAADSASTFPPAVSARLAQAAVVRAGFTQIKTLAALRRPLTTHGELVFARGHGVIWQIEAPYRIGYAITPETVTELAPDGTRTVRSARELPALAQVGRVFEALFSGDTGALDTQFTIAASGDELAWRLELTPIAPLDRFLTRIRAEGGAFITHIEVEERGGDHTRIDFTNPQRGQTLSPAEAQLLGAR
jgi:outer membrane lipoprotein-sorting protein